MAPTSTCRDLKTELYCVFKQSWKEPRQTRYDDINESGHVRLSWNPLNQKRLLSLSGFWRQVLHWQLNSQRPLLRRSLRCRLGCY